GAGWLPAPGVRSPAPLHQPPLLERVEQADKLAAVELEDVRDRALGGTRPLGEQGEDAVLVHARADRLELLHRPLFQLKTEPSEQEDRVGNELSREAGLGLEVHREEV